MVAEAPEQHRSLHTQAGRAGCTDIHAYRQQAHVPGRMSQPPGTMRTMRQLAAMGSPAWLSEGGSAAALSRSRVVFAFWKRALFWERFCYLLLPRPPWRIHRSASPITSQNSLPHPSASPWHFSRPVMTWFADRVLTSSPYRRTLSRHQAQSHRRDRYSRKLRGARSIGSNCSRRGRPS